MSFGQTLRAAREAKGLTLSKVAHDTRILVQIVTDMENEDFHRIPAAIYGRGFVRLFAEEVGLDPAPLIQEFMDIFSGKRAPMAAVPPPPPEPVPVEPEPEPAAEAPAYEETPIPPTPSAPTASPYGTYGTPNADEVEAPPPVTPFATPAAEAPASTPAYTPATESEPAYPPATETAYTTAIEPEPEPEPAPAPVPPPTTPAVQPAVVKGLDLFEQPAQPAVRPAPAPQPAAPQAQPPQIDATSPYLTPNYEDNGPSVGERFTAGLSNLSSNLVHRVHAVPRSVWRISLLACSVVLILALIVFGCIKLYQATTPATDPCANGVCEIDLPAKPANAQQAPATQPAPATPGAPATKPTATPAKPAPRPATPGKLRTTGEAVPSLYMD